ncbi:MAG: hypothetical protein GX130_07140 [Candidatus Hydrogenedens sp.]|nr:hypothetical protein [Candidatus Hydrogenedens sp.]
MLSFSRFKKEAVMIRRIFKGEPHAYRLLIERYQPMTYAVALANTGSVFLADKATAAAFESGYGRLISLTDPRKLGIMMCGLAQVESDNLLSRRAANWNLPRTRREASPVDLQWIQTELIEPLMEELGSFTHQERMGILLHSFCGMNPRQIAEVLKIEHKEAAEDLARTRENVEAALLKEVRKALFPEINNAERLAHIVTTVGGQASAEKALKKTTLGKRRGRRTPLLLTTLILLVVGIGAYFGYTAFYGVGPQLFFGEGPTSSEGTSAQENDPSEESRRADRPAPTNYSIEGRVVDIRFIEDGLAGLTVRSQDKEVETDSYGAFEIRGVARGEHRVSVYYGDKLLRENVRHHTNQKNPSIEVEMDPSMPTRFKMVGRVTDRLTGLAIREVEQACIKEHTTILQPFVLNMFQKQENEDGFVRVNLLTPGDYTVWVRAKGYAPLAVPFVIDEHWDAHEIVEIPLHRAASLEGILYNANELSINGANILPREGSRMNLTKSRISYKETDSMGRFEIYELPIGVHSLLFASEDHGTGRAIVQLESGKTTRIRVQVPRSSTISGDLSLHGRPAQFKDLRRRLGGSYVDLLKTVNYLSPGQYELPFTPETVFFWGSVEPGAGDNWFDRRMEQEAEVTTSQTTWIDFNFDDGKGSIQGNVSLQGATPRSAFVEIVLNGTNNLEKDRIFYDLGSSGSYHASRLPLKSGEVIVYATPNSVSQEEFWQSRSSLKRKSTSFTLDEGKTSLHINFNL